MHPIASALPDTPCYLDGEYTPLCQAKVSVLDRGFIFGDGVYEVVPAYGGRPFCFDEHMARLGRSLAEVQIANPMTADAWRRIALRVIEGTPEAERQGMQGIYIQVTRGVAPRDHAMTQGITPTVFVMVNPIRPPSEAARTQGVFCVTAHDFRWQKAHIKCTSLLGAVLARQISIEAGATETIMFRGEWLSEASSSNVWVVKDGAVFGPPRDELVLAGIRFGLIETLCKEAGIAFELRPITRAEVFGADEVFLSSASKELLPVRKIDDQLIGAGEPGPIYRQLDAGYQRAKARLSTDTGVPA